MDESEAVDFGKKATEGLDAQRVSERERQAPEPQSGLGGAYQAWQEVQSQRLPSATFPLGNEEQLRPVESS